ncbi:hypothetical protein PACTADRAFT_50112 [Pachysolen tannophilus NRRL Y-2460]|uniref:Type 2A phosphatase activator TIP41 n=1 Tax=Pachysolen tannophilus NRRL Y-2460 TaxID=669874 RepID=A0A1E4TUH1_PACTA|nr:hypothetical protein PACTADRAFT_50112 [Pachysolen tannophilus NRRL Y-2460]
MAMTGGGSENSGDNGNDSNDKKIAPASQSTFNTPGIAAVHINAAREAVELHTRDRRPNLTLVNNKSQRIAQTAQTAPMASTASTAQNLQNLQNAQKLPKAPKAQLQQGQKFQVPLSKKKQSTITTSTSTSTDIKIPTHHSPSSTPWPCSNPQCQHCGSVIIPAPQSSLPIRDVPSISIKNWDIYLTKNPILNATELEDFEKSFNFPLPEMIFGNNGIEIYNPILKWGFKVNCFDSLKLIDDNVDPSKLLKVSYANDWYKARQVKHNSNSVATGTINGSSSNSSSNKNDNQDISSGSITSGSSESIMEIYKSFDWTYTTTYKGDEFTNNAKHFQKDNTREIPLHKLTDKLQPILFYQEFVLYEDELGDNGISILSCKVRCMKNCMLLLLRFFLRVDNVIFRINDTRLYIDFEENLIIREFKTQESSYNDLLKKINPSSGDPRSLLRDSNWVAQNTKLLKAEREYVEL